MALPMPYAMADASLSATELHDALQVLLAEEFVKIDGDLLLLPKAMRYQRPETDNHIKHAVRQLDTLPESPLWRDFYESCKRYAPKLAEAVAEKFSDRIRDAIPDGMADGMPNGNGYSPCSMLHAQSPSPVNTRRAPRSEFDGYPDDFERFWMVYPRRVDKRKAFRAWQARLKQGAHAEDMIMAAAAYASAKAGKDPQYLKHAATFLGPDKAFEEWVHGAPEAAQNQGDATTAMLRQWAEGGSP